jgi:hypothetical protein
VDWTDASVDGSAFVADPEPMYHLAAWLDEPRGAWDWHVLHGLSGSYPRKVGQSHGRLERDADGARHAAEAAYRRHRDRARDVVQATR